MIKEIVDNMVHKNPILRIGMGNDLHTLVVKRKLILGGVAISFKKGSSGHSDGDALSHAICDALLGAAGLRDLGYYFPDSDQRWLNVSSLMLLKQASILVAKAGFKIGNIDTIIELERPKLKDHISKMRKILSKTLKINIDQIGIKAKTGEGIEAIGKGRAIKASAVVLLIKQ